MVNSKILDIIACPVCKGTVHLSKNKQFLICYNDRLAYPIENGIPVMLEDQAQTLTFDEIEKEKNG
ncbi:Trm112 family protein [Thiotrichales bacterium 19S3-7]|nr:Trm112 family protein [Thiotrichales bacterium 19S3-7]MCF6802511.1 Trm112 family protein [Thiotrichales bacterium 19S3-11]